VRYLGRFLENPAEAPEHFRRRILIQLNRGEGRHGLSRDVCHGRRGELRQPYREGQEEQLGALGLIVNTIVVYNTIYTQRALDHIAATTGSEPRDEDIERLSPLGSDHATLTGRYRVLLPAPLHDRAAYRPLNTPESARAAQPGFPYETSRYPYTVPVLKWGLPARTTVRVRVESRTGA